MKNKNHTVSAQDVARILAKTYEPSLDWKNPDEYDLLDREELTENAEKFMRLLLWNGFVIERLDDLVLDEFK